MTGPLPGWLAPLTRPAARLYARAVDRRNRRFDARRDVHRAAVPVVSIGNITAGGVGKTPFVAWLAERLIDDGHRPVIVMRGYGARRGTGSDEAAEFAGRLPAVPVLVDPDRVASLARFLPDHPEIDVALMDDGFQHRRLHRDVDLVLIDAMRPGLGDRLLPAGRLREPAANLRRADAVVVTRADRVDRALEAAIADAHGVTPLAWCAHRWRGLEIIDAEGVRREPVAWLEGRAVVTRFGVGN
ncbi:MAG: tetraacyldisaccharide 4'-kinase, partial [Phycisphaerales bacterium]|nr:tetraacyldisaccharide 4'-kinase [Phycisphaerales bacterium]